MDDIEDLYLIIGLPSGPEGGIDCSQEVIRKAYRAKALTCHPDKRPDDPLAAGEFQKLQKAYDVLSDEKARKAYNDLLHVRKARLEREARADSKRRKMMEDLDKREKYFELQRKEKDEEEKASKRLQEEIARIRATRGRKVVPSESVKSDQLEKPAKTTNVQDQEKMLKVTWLAGSNDYSAGRLHEIFSHFGCVEDVVILQQRKSAKQYSALVVMSSGDEVLFASKQMLGDLAHPLRVVPLVADSSFRAENSFVSRPMASAKNGESTYSNIGSLVGNVFQDHEDSVLNKMRKKAESMGPSV